LQAENEIMSLLDEWEEIDNDVDEMVGVLAFQIACTGSGSTKSHWHCVLMTQQGGNINGNRITVSTFSKLHQERFSVLK
jgi:hypothetical protein